MNTGISRPLSAVINIAVSAQKMLCYKLKVVKS